MMEIELIKKAVLFADGFEIRAFNGSLIIEHCHFLCCPLDGLSEDLVLSPLFLQKVIEGINRSDDNSGYIDQSFSCIKATVYLKKQYEEEFTIDYNNIDKAKEEAIKFILEPLK